MNVTDDQIEMFVADRTQPFPSGAMPVDSKTFQSEAVAQRFAHDFVVFDQADDGLRVFTHVCLPAEVER